jgi:hypothetical protein
MMTKAKPKLTGPMNTQRTQYAAICPALPLMPTPGSGPQVSQTKMQPSRTDAVGKAKAKMMRRASLRKQREGQKAKPL